MKAVTVEELTVAYGKTQVLWQVSFSVKPGQIVGIIGPNGAGKSTLIKALLGLVKPLSGKISFFSRPYQSMRKGIAYVPQRNSVDWNFPISVLDVVLMGSYGHRGLLKWVTQKDKKLAKEALEKVGMLPFEKRQISELSGGQQQRVFFARALMQNADLYFMDEPFAGIDMATEKALIELLMQLKHEGKTLLIVHHDLATVETCFDSVILLNTCLIDYGPTKQVMQEENLQKAYGSAAYLLKEAKKQALQKSTGI